MATIGTYVDDLVALLEKLVGFVGEVVLDTVLRGTIGLVDVYPACRAAESASDVADIGGCAANCMVEDQNARCSSTVEKFSVCFVRWSNGESELVLTCPLEAVQLPGSILP